MRLAAVVRRAPCASVAFALALSCASLGYADSSPDPKAAAEAAEEQPAEQDDEAAKLERSLHFRNGDVMVGDNLATLKLGDALRYLDPADTEKVLVAWGNPPGSQTLGMVMPSAVSPFAEESWAVIVSYAEEGHVEDEDAKDINYTELLGEMKEDTEAANEQRQKDGYPAAHLVGWAEPPHYDQAARKLYWAKELDFGNPEHTLNYDIRVLGRKGVLELSAVASMAQLPMVKAEMPKILASVDFNPGMRYADFKPGMDNVAAYGIGALVAGKLAAKAGFFKILIAALLAGKKLVVAAAVGLGLFVKKLLTRGKQETAEAAPPQEPAA